MRRRRTWVSLLAVCLSAIAAGCGSSSSSTTTNGPLATELSYFPAGSPLVATIATDPQGTAVQNAQGLLGAFPLATLGITALEAKLQSSGINYQTEIEPLFGNPVTIGALQIPTAARLSGSSFLAVWITKSAAKLDALVKGLNGLAANGNVDGATMYGSSALTIAVDGATAVVGSSRAAVTAALARHTHGGGISYADFSKAMGNLPQDALVRAFGSLSSALSGPGAGRARSLPFVAAIRGYAATISATSAGVNAQFRLDTSGGPLTSSELPLASGTAPPELAGTLPLAIGVHDPAQTLTFIAAAAQAADPGAYARFTSRENAARRKTGYDLNTFATLLTGNLTVETDRQTILARADVADRASAARQLAKLAPVARDVFPSAKGVTQAGGFYTVSLTHGQSLNFGLVGNEFVAGVATPAQLRAFAAAPATPAPNAQGPVAFRADIVDLLRLATKHAPSTIVTSILSILGEITGSASATPGAVTAHLNVPVK